MGLGRRDVGGRSVRWRACRPGTWVRCGKPLGRAENLMESMAAMARTGEKRVVLHIGMHKTGSTSVQAAYESHSIYCKFGPPNHSIAATTVFHRDPYDYHIHKRARLTRAEVDEKRMLWRSELEESLGQDKETLLLSGEDFSLLDRDGVQEFASVVGGVASNVEVYAYVRPPLSFSTSAFQQHVAQGARRFLLPLPRYRERFEKFGSIFGQDRLRLRLYDRSRFDAGDVVSDFAQWARIPSAGRIGRDSNRSLSAAATAALFIWNREGMAGRDIMRNVPVRRKILRVLRSLPGPSLQLSAKMIAVDHDDVRWLESTAKFSLEEQRDDSGISSEEEFLELGRRHLDELTGIVMDALR